MTLPPVYCDHDSSHGALVEQLRRLGVDVLTPFEAGNRPFDDDQQLLYATQLGRAIYTANRRDFARLQAQWARDGRSHAGIIIRSMRYGDVGVQLRSLLAVLEAHQTTGLADRILYV